jgi:hypothetical protein
MISKLGAGLLRRFQQTVYLEGEESISTQISAARRRRGKSRFSLVEDRIDSKPERGPICGKSKVLIFGLNKAHNPYYGPLSLGGQKRIVTAF